MRCFICVFLLAYMLGCDSSTTTEKTVQTSKFPGEDKTKQKRLINDDGTIVDNFMELTWQKADTKRFIDNGNGTVSGTKKWEIEGNN